MLKNENQTFRMSQNNPVPPSRFHLWIQAARPKTLWAAFIPVLMGTAMASADQKFHLASSLAAFFVAFSLQIGTNFSNDYYDFLNGADTEERIGPTRLTQAGLIKPEAMRLAFILSFLISFLLGIYLSFRAGWIILGLGILSILSGFFYTAGSKPLGYLGLGDIFVLVFFGPVAVCGTYFVQALEFRPETFFVGLIPGFLSMAILVVNNLRDYETDRKAGKRTLVVRFGKTFGKFEYLTSLLMALVIPVILCFQLEGHYLSLLSFLSFIIAFSCLHAVFFKEGAALNPILGRTGKLLFFYGFLFSIGWVL